MNFQSTRWREKLAVFVDFNERLKLLSTCKRAQVGCIVFPPNFSSILAIGYNGQPAGVPNDKCTGLDGCGCLHAERNALSKLRDWRTGCILISTLAPCYSCTQAIQSHEIEDVIYLQDWNNNHYIGVRYDSL